jgi:hypothetical protein
MTLSRDLVGFLLGPDGCQAAPETSQGHTGAQTCQRPSKSRRQPGLDTAVCIGRHDHATSESGTSFSPAPGIVMPGRWRPGGDLRAATGRDHRGPRMPPRVHRRRRRRRPGMHRPIDLATGRSAASTTRGTRRSAPSAAGGAGRMHRSGMRRRRSVDQVYLRCLVPRLSEHPGSTLSVLRYRTRHGTFGEYCMQSSEDRRWLETSNKLPEAAL